MIWDLELGAEVARTELQLQHGGSLSRGISAPRLGGDKQDIMLWWRPEHAKAFGYSDGWAHDGDAFYFTGTGQEGDQRFGTPHAENGRVRDHAGNGDRLRLLRYVSKNKVRYLGELVLDPEAPWTFLDGPDRHGQVRRMIQFRLLPADDSVLREGPYAGEPLLAVPTMSPVPPLPQPATSPLEKLNTATFERVTAAQRLTAERRELVLVHSFSSWLAKALGLTSTGLRIPYAPERRNLVADLFLPEPGVLVEAKASAARENVRMAIGQLLDYRRYVDPTPRLCVLTPTEPAADMLRLLQELEIAAVWADHHGFKSWPASELASWSG